MTQAYSNPKRASDPHALPDVEVFWNAPGCASIILDDGTAAETGWYWWSCFPGCMPDGEPSGPFATQAEALADARDGCDDDDDDMEVQS